MSLLGNFLLLLFLWILVESIRVVEDVVSLRVVPCISHLFIEVGEATIWSWNPLGEALWLSWPTGLQALLPLLSPPPLRSTLLAALTPSREIRPGSRGRRRSRLSCRRCYRRRRRP